MSALRPAEADLDKLGYDKNFLLKELDRTKSQAFIGKPAAFLGPLMCSLNFFWTEDIPTAATDGLNLMWNQHWFMSLQPETRKTVLLHEIWHVALLHMVRCGARNPRLWNYACDISINNTLTHEGFSFVGVEDCWRDPSFPLEMPEEDIYNALFKNAQQAPQQGAWGKACHVDPDLPSDMLPSSSLSKSDQALAVGNVVRAAHQARMTGKPGAVPGHVETILKNFLAPIIPWESVLHRFLQEDSDDTFSLKRPNRRFPDMYLPGRVPQEGRLTNLIYYEDVSGSITDADALRFNSEVKYVKDILNPPKLTLVQFDTQIRDEKLFLEHEPFEEIKIIGRGGTSLVPVRKHIIEHRPTAAIIFSDLECEKMVELPFHVPIIWVCIANKRATVPFGQVIHIR